MKATVTALCVVSAFMSTASCLQCTVCSWIVQESTSERYFEEYLNKPTYEKIIDGQPFCSGANQLCPLSEDACAYIHVKMTKYDWSQEIFIKRGCYHQKECNVSESFTTPVLKISYAITCCEKDNCVPALPILPTENKIKNGVLCPSCLSLTNEKCEAKRAIECTGEEKYCITYQKINPFDESGIYTMGCASKNVCKGNGDLGILLKTGSVNYVTCANSSNDEQLRPGHFIWCIFCHSYNQKNCSDKSYLCSLEEDVCVFETTRSIYDGRDEIEINKRCGKSIECVRAGSMRSSTKTIFMNTTCCDYNLCQAPYPTLPSVHNEENGLSCPACFVPNSDRCLGRSSLKCTGKEQHCVHYMKTEVQEISTITESLHGCTTKEICEAGSTIFSIQGVCPKSVKTNVICSRAVGWVAPLGSILLFMTVAFIVLIFIIFS